MLARLKKKLPAILTCLVLIALMTGLDQWTKWAIVKSIPLGGTEVIIPGFFELTYIRNTGAAFSSLDGIGMWFFILLTIAAIAAMVYYFVRTDDTKIEFALALITAGAIGNLIDRMLFGYVRDFFRFYIFGHPFAVFNVADVCITVGFILLAVIWLSEEWKQSHPSKERKASHE